MMFIFSSQLGKIIFSCLYRQSAHETLLYYLFVGARTDLVLLLLLVLVLILVLVLRLWVLALWLLVWMPLPQPNFHRPLVLHWMLLPQICPSLSPSLCAQFLP
jgi:type IV secretory pathway TrbD component